MNVATWFHVFRADTKRIVRDPFLLLVTTYMPPMTILLQWGIPKLAELVKGQIDLVPYYPVFCVMFVLIIPLMMGTVLGMQMLGEKDERSLKAIAVTPFSFKQYFISRAVLFALLGMALLLLCHWLINLVHTVPVSLLIPIALVFGLNAPVSALVLAGLARNQVEGFAVMKASGFLFTVPGLSFFIPQPWDFVMGIFPFYWPLKAYFLSAAQGSLTLIWICLVVGVLTQLAAIWFLYKRFERQLYDS